jgi:hypothetical protein
MKSRSEPITPEKIKSFAEHSGRILTVSWEEAKVVMTLIPAKDGEEMSTFEWNDLRLRIAQHIAIEINKIIRHERF